MGYADGAISWCGTRYREELLSMGLRIAPGAKARQHLTTYIQSSQPAARARCVTQTSWHKNCFVFPDHTIGSMGAKRLILQVSSSHFQDYAVSGCLEDWKNGVSLFCRGNTRLIFSVSVAFASPLLNLLGIENGGFHFRGASSTGKTTALAVAASVWGSKEYIQRWRATRRSKKDQRPKYIEISGSMKCPSLYGLVDKAILIVEAELDAMLIQYYAADLCVCIAIGGAGKKTDFVSDALLKQTPIILFALDFDAAGMAAYQFWRSTYPHLRAWPASRGKSPGDALKLGVGLRRWILEGLKTN